MFLSRIFLNARHRLVRRDLGSFVELHRTVMRAFPIVAEANARARHKVLHRTDLAEGGQSPVLYVQSAAEPCWDHLEDGYLAPAAFGESNPGVRPLSDFIASISVGTLYRFRLRANATRRISRESGGSTRVPLRTEEALGVWLLRRGAACGFTASDAEGPTFRSAPEGPTRAKSGSQMITLEGVRFDGLLRVQDPEPFQKAIVDGLGSAKAFGFGLLSLAPSPQ